MLYLVNINQILLSREGLDFRHGAVMAVFRSVFSSSSQQIKNKMIIEKNSGKNIFWYWVSWEIIKKDLPCFNFNSINTIKKIILDLICKKFLIKRNIKTSPESSSKFGNKFDKCYYTQGQRFDEFFKAATLEKKALPQTQVQSQPQSQTHAEAQSERFIFPNNNYFYKTSKKTICEGECDCQHSPRSSSSNIKSSIKSRIKSNSTSNIRFEKPSVEEIEEWIKENDIDIDPAVFWDYYEAKGWLVGRSKMKDWQAAVRNWSRRREEWQRTKFGINMSSNKKSAEQEINTKLWGLK